MRPSWGAILHAKLFSINRLKGSVWLVTGSALMALIRPRKSREIDGILSLRRFNLGLDSRLNYATAEVQYAHLRAPIGMSLRHSGHCFLSGAAAGSFL